MAFTYAYECVEPHVIAAVSIGVPRFHNSTVAWTNTWRVHVRIMQHALVHASKFANEASLDDFIAACSADTDLKFLLQAHGEMFWNMIQSPARLISVETPFL